MYDVAATALLPSTQRVDVRFFFVPNNGKDLEVITAQDDPDREASLRHLLARIERDATRGSFAPTPSGNKDYCPGVSDWAGEPSSPATASSMVPTPSRWTHEHITSAS